MPPTGGAPGTGCARGATLLLLVLALSVTGAVASRAALTATALDPVARWYVVEDTLPPELLADTYNPHITIGDVIGHFANAPDNTEYWDTHWRALFPWFVIQMKSSPNRVYTYEEADFVFVPVCMGKCSRPWPYDNAYNTTHDHAFLKTASQYLPQLYNIPHLMVLNAPIADAFGVSMAEAQPFFFIGLERPEGRVEDYNWRYIAAPYPSHEHPNIFTEERDTPESALARKNQLVVGTYINRFADTDRTHMRQRLFEDCAAHPVTCTHYDFPPQNVPEAVPLQAAAYRQYSSRHFCLQPPGDWWIRGADFDCMVQLGRPVVFDDYFERHTAFSDVIDYSKLLVKLPNDPAPGFSVIDHLESIYNETEALESLAYLIKYRRIFQLAINPVHYMVSFSHRNMLHKRDDAFTFTLKDFLRRMCNQAAGTDRQNPKCNLVAPLSRS